MVNESDIKSNSRTENVSLADFFGNNTVKKVVSVKPLAKPAISKRTNSKPPVSKPAVSKPPVSKPAVPKTVTGNPVQTTRKGSRYKGKQIAVPQPELLAKNTLDATHKSRMKHFKDERKSLNSKKKEILSLTKELGELNSVPLSTRDFHRIVAVEESMKKLQKEIDYIESGQGELEYYTKTGELLMEYYEHINSMKKKGRKGGKKKSGGKAKGAKSVYDMFMKPQASASLQSHLASAALETDDDAANDEREGFQTGGLETGGLETGGLETGGLETGGLETEEENIAREKEPKKQVSVLDCLASLGLSTFTDDKKPEKTCQDQDPETNAPMTPKSADDLPKAIKAITSDQGNGQINGNKEGENKPLQFLGSLAGFVEKQEVFNRADYFDEYLSIIDPHFVRDENSENQEPDKDSYCGRCNCYRYMNHSEAMMICPECHSYEAIVIDSDKPNYKDPPVEISNFPYRRINHFNECLSQFQAKESTEIPQIVYDTILMEMKKERITNMADLTRDKVHKYLKKQPNKKFTNYYEHIPHIINRLTGIKPKTMTPKQEDELRTMFHAIQEPYERHKPKHRKNFLNYNYVLHKFCQLKGYVDFLDCFPLLKSKEKLYQQDLVWKKICYELEWVYFPSI